MFGTPGATVTAPMPGRGSGLATVCVKMKTGTEMEGD